MIKPDDRERHIALYAKRWYKRSKDPIRDLKKIIGKFNAVKPRYLATYDVYLILLDVFWTLVDDYKKRLFFERLPVPVFVSVKNGVFVLNKRARILGIRTLTLEMMATLANVQVQDEQGNLLIDLGEPDPKVLPLS